MRWLKPSKARVRDDRNYRGGSARTSRGSRCGVRGEGHVVTQTPIGIEGGDEKSTSPGVEHQSPLRKRLRVHRLHLPECLLLRQDLLL